MRRELGLHPETRGKAVCSGRALSSLDQRLLIDYITVIAISLTIDKNRWKDVKTEESWSVFFSF